MGNTIEAFSQETTFVIQGLVTPFVNEIIRELRRLFPGASVIVSTCNDINVEIVGADQIVRSEDPGCLYYSNEPGAAPNNVNRQIRSTRAGLERVKTKYAFKLRSDFLPTHNRFFEYFDRFGKVDPAYQVFERKLLACCYFSRNPHEFSHYPYHVSDLSFFGLTSDLLKLFEAPLLTEDQAYVERMKKGKQILMNKYFPEQYLLISHLRKCGKAVFCENFDDATAHSSEETDRFFASNFIFLGFDAFGLKPTKAIFRMDIFPGLFRDCYTHVEWQRLYQKHVDPQHILPPSDDERASINAFYRANMKYRVAAKALSFFFISSQARKRVRRAFFDWHAKRKMKRT